jgi:hypothetical protein
MDFELDLQEYEKTQDIRIMLWGSLINNSVETVETEHKKIVKGPG